MRGMELTTGVYSEREKSFRSELACKLAGEENVGCFRLPVPRPPIVVFALIEIDIVQTTRSNHVAITGEVDDASILPGCQDFGKDKSREEEVAEVVGGELRFDTVLVGGKGYGHNTGVVHHDVNFRDSFVDSYCSLPDGVEVVKLYGHECEFDGSIESLNLRHDWGDFS